MNEKTYSLVFTQGQINILGQALAVRPYSEVAALIDAINKQLQVQLAPSSE